MKRSVLPLLFAAALATALHAASSKAAPTDWAVVAKTSEGKTLTVPVNATGDIGAVATDAVCAAVPVVALNADNREYPEILVLMPPAKVKDFLKAAEPRKTGKRGTFGAKIDPGLFTGILATVGGERVFLVGDLKAAAVKEKPSAILAAQRAAAKDGVVETRAEPAPAPPKKPVR